MTPSKVIRTQTERSYTAKWLSDRKYGLNWPFLHHRVAPRPQKWPKLAKKDPKSSPIIFTFRSVRRWTEILPWPSSKRTDFSGSWDVVSQDVWSIQKTTTAGLLISDTHTKSQFSDEPEGLRHFQDHRWKALGEENPILSGPFLFRHYFWSYIE